MEIKDEEFVHNVEARDAIEDTDEESRTHEQKIALENLTRHVRVDDLETLESLADELSEVEALKDKHVYKLLELMPQHESTVRSVFSKERVRLEDDDVEQILDICTSVDVEE